MVCSEEGGKLPSILLFFIRLRIGVDGEGTSFHGSCTPGLEFWIDGIDVVGHAMT